jgi:S1-C subfamily serine protease
MGCAAACVAWGAAAGAQRPDERDPLIGEPRARFDRFGLVVAEAPGGVVVQAVQRGGPAYGRLDVFDVIRRVDDVNVKDEVDFDRLTRRAGPTATLFVWRSRLRRDEVVVLPNVGGGVEAPPSERILGVRYAFHPDDGVTIVHVAPGSPAAAAGLRRGLNLVEINGEVMTSGDLVEQAVERGGRLRMRLFDRDRKQWTNATVDLPPAEAFGGLFEQRLGVVLENLDRGAGVTFARVNAGGPAARAGIRPRDLLLELQGQRVRTVDDVRRLGPLDARVVRLAIRSAVGGDEYGPRVEKLVRLD